MKDTYKKLLAGLSPTRFHLGAVRAVSYGRLSSLMFIYDLKNTNIKATSKTPPHTITSGRRSLVALMQCQ